MHCTLTFGYSDFVPVGGDANLFSIAAPVLSDRPALRRPAAARAARRGMLFLLGCTVAAGDQLIIILAEFLAESGRQ